LVLLQRGLRVSCFFAGKNCASLRIDTSKESPEMKQNQQSLPILFFAWFFVAQPGKIIASGKNTMHWVWQYFSIGFLLPRLFASWHRDITSYGRGFDLKRSLHALGWNMISRVIGAFLRVVFIILGLAFELCVLIGTIFALVLWYSFPIIVLFLAIGKISLEILQT